MSKRMERDLGSLGVLSLTATGTLAVVVGLWLPWFVVPPDHVGVIPRIYRTGMEAGIEGFDYLVLAVTLVGAISPLFFEHARTRARAAVSTASLTLLLAMWYISRTAGLDGTYMEVFVVGRGASLTLFGGGLLLVSGVLRYVLDGATDIPVPARTDSD